MTAILRIINVSIENSSSISVSFTENLTHNLIPDNISILSQLDGVPNSQVLKISVLTNTLNITCQPLTPLTSYFLQFQSTANNPFISVNGDAKISQDGVSNRYLINGPADPSNPITTYLNAFYKDNIYNTTDPTTKVYSYIQGLATNFARALYDIRQTKNENYLSYNIIDEQHTRGTGPFDRLNEEAAYDIFRVGLGKTNTAINTSLAFNDFPFYPISLQQKTVNEYITIASDNSSGTFNPNSLTFNLGNNPVIKVNSIVFTFLTDDPVYNYDVQALGYQLLNSTFDQDFASTYLLLEDNQVKINEKVLQDSNFILTSIFSITINYEYKSLGINIDPNSVNIYTTLQSVREVLPPIVNVFSLQHAPITDQSNNIPLLNGVLFTDPNSNGSAHPAFLTEIPFRLNALPVIAGQYSIDYTSGTVYVYGADTTNDGTGSSPPLATYFYKFTYVSEIDYVYDKDLLEVVALSNGNLINNTGTINFNYEQVLIPNTDYIADSHIESLNERIDNKLIALNTLKTNNFPITNVFQIYNETSGEIYTLDRWNNNLVYFRYNNPPRILSQVGENATFNTITNELLSVNSTITNINSLRVFIILLANNTIINSTQDAIAASFNTSLIFTNGNVFVSEKWYNQEFDAAFNFNKLLNVGEYTVDYLNGVIYIAVSDQQKFDLGTVIYKNNSIAPEFPHLISVDDIYYRINLLNPKNKTFSYLSFTDGSIVLENLDISDEAFLNNVENAPFQLVNNTVGSFVDSTFVAGVSNQVKFIRSIFEYNDLLNSTNPINFNLVSTSNNFNITVGSINKQIFETVQFDGTNFYILINENIPYLSPGITFNFSIIRVFDQEQLWNSSGTIVAGNPIKLILPDINNPLAGQMVSVNYSFTIDTLQRVVVDYNKGDFFVDYTYLADEILVSYEYGDNVIDFRQNTNVPAGTQYYVSYKVGALRDALLKNFGTLVNVEDLASFDLTLDRERYREALQAALSSFIQGPTIEAIKNIGKTISHIEPEVIEAAFSTWSLGSSLLTPVSVQTTGDFQLIPAHFGNGALINQSNQTITLPINSNLRLEEGTFETWILPQWNGLDNDALLTFTITKDGLPVNSNTIFIGSSEYHPILTNNAFSLNKLNSVSGKPNTNKDGVFIYYDNDISGNFKRWYVEVIDGYVHTGNHTYKIKINTDGKYYDTKSTDIIQSSNVSFFTGLKTLNITINTVGHTDETITFLADLEHYILDLGENHNTCRFSIFKDVSGYMNFRVFDKFNNLYNISADVSGWQINQAHMVAASWKLNTKNKQDEMHLFIDGFEVPNTIKYGQKNQPYLHQKFRTVSEEDILGLANRDIVGSDDLMTIEGSNTVSSTINFSDFNIVIGDTIFIDEVGFLTSGYTITNIDGQTLILNDDMPLTITAGRYSVNRTSFVVASDVIVSPNTIVSTIHTFVSGSDLQTFEGSNIINSTTLNFVSSDVTAGDLIRIDNSDFNLFYTILTVSAHSLTISDNLPDTLTNATYQIYTNNQNELPGVKALHPDYSLSQDNNFNNILTISNGVFANDLIIIDTLGLNNQDVKKRYYVWSNEVENILMTQLPPPVSLNQVNITKIITPSVAIGNSNSTLSGGIFTSNLLPTAHPSNALIGRTIQATISGTNVDFTSPVQVILTGSTINATITETITFTNYGTLDFINQYVSLNHVEIIVKPINTSKNALAIELKEKYSMTHSESSGLVPVIRYSYNIGSGYTLSGNGLDNFVYDINNLFSYLDIGNYLIIQSPAPVAGYYIITGISTDRHGIEIQSTSAAFSVPLTAFTDGIYQILNVNDYRSGLQNGFFTFESNILPSQPYFLSQGFYELSYATYTSIRFNNLNSDMYFGSDLHGHLQANCIMDQTTIYSEMLTDTRIGEVIADNALSITKDFNSLKAPKTNSNTLVLLNLDSFPFSNNANFYSNINDNIHFESNFAVNDNFDNSIVILDKPIKLSNDGILDSRKQGTIEFWMSPIFDTANDPVCRYYFDAYSAIVEETVSINNVSIQVSSPIGQVLSIKLAAGNQNIDYFAGGTVDVDTQNAIQEDAISIGTSSVTVSQPILQVVSVQIIGDLTQTDYFDGGSISANLKTIYLNKTLPQSNLPLVITYVSSNNNSTINKQIIRLNRKLPSQNTKVIVSYLPKGIQGDRLSIFKDKVGYINFSINASDTNFTVRAPTRWAQNTWHRVKASYKINNGMGNDEMRLFLDGYQYTDILFGENATFGAFPIISGAITVGDGYSLFGTINFKDPINELYIGTNYLNQNPIFTLLDNFRISNISRPLFTPFGEPIDVNYSSNLSTVFPVTKDLFTTYLMDFDLQPELTTAFATLIDRETGAFDFTVNIFDDLDIISSSSPQVKEILENLINILKPANSTVYIKYL